MTSSPPRRFDGVVCFGGVDWWYHNRGHYDLQMMSQLCRHVPVIYVNSIGVRVPKPGEGRMFLRRVSRKLRSLLRGRVQVRENFAVLSLLLPPGRRWRAPFRALARRQLGAACRAAGIREPLLWITCPTGADFVHDFPESAVVYERSDRWEEFPGADRAEILAHHAFLQSRAVVTLYASRELHRAESRSGLRCVYLDHGVDFESFARAGAGPGPDPDDLAGVPRPRAGFVGSIDSHTFDVALFRDVAARLPDVSFVLVGPSSLGIERWQLANVRYLGQKSYESVPRYMASCDVLIMPWCDNEWIRACNPVKLKEYLAVGRPVVSSPFPELESYRGYVATARGAAEFAAKIRSALAAPTPAARLRERVRAEGWDAKGAILLATLHEAGIVPASRCTTRA